LQTNNRAELYAVIRALETCEDQLKIHKWKKNRWKTLKNQNVKNKDLFEKIDFLLAKRHGKVYFTYVFGHRGITGNEIADKLAKCGASIKMNEKTIPTCWNCLSLNQGICYIEETTDEKIKLGSSLKNEKKIILNILNHYEFTNFEEVKPLSLVTKMFYNLMKNILLNISLKQINHNYKLEINNKNEDCDELKFDQISSLCQDWVITEII
ncbi:24929_t:CDS:2, partial [Racocetra persica]